MFTSQETDKRAATLSASPVPTQPMGTPICDPKRQDPLRRMRSTPLVAHLPVMGRTICVETNTPTVMEGIRALWARYPSAAGSDYDFRWRIVCEPARQAGPPWPEVLSFSDAGLRYVSFGQYSFIAIDLTARQAVGYLAEGLLADAAGFVSPFLNTLFILTAGGLGLTPLPATCVAMGDKALLVLGDANNGKTTASYLTARLGSKFHSDGSVFLDWYEGRLLTWGDFSPAVFRLESAKFLPELLSIGRPFHYRDCTFLYVEEGTSIRANGHPVTPVACVFLERGAASTPRLTPLGSLKSQERLEAIRSFRDDEPLEAQHCLALRALAQVPAYQLAYGNDPAVAATFLRNILTVHSSLEAAR